MKKRAEYKTGQMLVQAGNKVTWFRNQKLKHYNLTSEQAGVITCMKQSGKEGITTGELVRQLNHTKSTVSEILKKMEAKKLVKRYEDPDDGRKRRVVLTEQGLEDMSMLNRVSSECEQIVLKGMSDDEKKEFNRLLAVALENMNSFQVTEHSPGAGRKKEKIRC